MNVNINGYTKKTGIPTVYVITTGVTTVTTQNGHCVFLADASGGISALTLPRASNNTDCFVIKKIDSSANVVKIQMSTGSGDKIDGSSGSVGIKVQYGSVTVVSDGSNWHII